ncbi:MAG: heme NO-binding domain-containing protein, partial [Acidimicrobiia bacterium]
MKGIVFKLLQEVVTNVHGEDIWDSLLESAGLEGAYTTVGNYPDEDLLKLVAAASDALKISGDDVVRWFGREALPLLYG